MEETDDIEQKLEIIFGSEEESKAEASNNEAENDPFAQDEENKDPNEIEDLSEELSKLRCEICDKDFQVEKSYKRHLMMHEIQANGGAGGATEANEATDANLTNETLSETLTDDSESNLVIDLNRSDQSEFLCGFCGKNFTNNWNFNNHIKLNHKTEMENEQDLSTSTDQDNTLEAEESENADQESEIRYECMECEKSYTRSEDLTLHLEETHGDVSENTDEDLEKTLEDVPSMCDQERFQCNQCDKSYSHDFNLKRHIKHKHEKSKSQNQSLSEFQVPEDDTKTNFGCDECDKTFASNRILQIHKELKHKTENSVANGEFSCDQCGKNFEVEKSLKLHKSHMHKNQKNNHGMKFNWSV